MSQYPSANDRRATVVARLLDFSFGTMWWVRETLWKQAIPPVLNYDRNSTRHGHPGISILLGPYPTKTSRVPLMHGTSGRRSRDCVTVSGYDHKNPSSMTYFGHLISAQHLPRIWIGNFAVDKSDFQREWQEMFGTARATLWTVRPQVFANRGKARATPAEHEALYQLLVRLGVIWPS